MVGLGKILYVEDDPDIRLIAELSLQTVGVTSFVCVIPASRP